MTSVSKLFLISAASGTGKSSLINSAINKIQKLGQKVELSISYTTRKERSDNQDYYFFIDKFDFQDKLNKNYVNPLFDLRNCFWISFHHLTDHESFYTPTSQLIL